MLGVHHLKCVPPQQCGRWGAGSRPTGASFTPADRLVGLTDEFAQALEAPQNRPVAFSEVRAARLQGQERMLRVAAKILGKFNGENPGDAEARQKLMTPIVDQNERIADYYRRKRPVPDIDPDSGEDIVTDE
jgi:ribosomal protein S15P/S13E